MRIRRNRGEQTPPGWIIDSEGNPTTDPNRFYGPPPGAILPFGGDAAHKGYGLSVIVEILSGALSGAGCSRPDAARMGNALFIQAINPAAFGPLDRFKRQVDDFTAFVKSSPTAPGFKEVLMPGEVEARELKKRSVDGIYVEEETWRQILDVARGHGVSA